MRSDAGHTLIAAKRGLRPRWIAFGLVSLGCAFVPISASADPAAQAAATPKETSATPSIPQDPTFTTGLFSSSRSTLLGDAGGLRSFLGNYGLSFNLTETSETIGNATGGVRRGAEYDGLTTGTLQLDTLRAFGLPGGLFNASALQIHGRNVSADNLLTLQTASGIEASPTTRLWELWYQQSFWNGAFDIKFGQQSVDQEFMASPSSALYLNTMMGWPLVPSYDLYAGGPAYPLSSLGARFRSEFTPHWTALVGVYDDNPPGGPFNDDSQLRGPEAYGVRFNTRTGALVFGELQYAFNQPSLGELAHANPGLPGVYKLGFWYDTAQFADQRLGTDGLSLADPASNGNPVQHRGNYSIYGLLDQVVYQPDRTGPKSLSVFVRMMGAPDDRNLISFSVNGGLNLKAPFEGRDNDTVGLGFGYGRVSGAVSAFDRDAAAFAGPSTFSTIRTDETFIEATYQVQLASWWQVQPDFQYVFRPGGGVVNPANPSQRLGNEAVFGLRTNITF
jgi:porin